MSNFPDLLLVKSRQNAAKIHDVKLLIFFSSFFPCPLLATTTTFVKFATTGCLKFKWFFPNVFEIAGFDKELKNLYKKSICNENKINRYKIWIWVKKKVFLNLLLQVILLLRNSCFWIFHGPIFPLLSMFNFIHTIKCNQEVMEP